MLEELAVDIARGRTPSADDSSYRVLGAKGTVGVFGVEDNKDGELGAADEILGLCGYIGGGESDCDRE